MQRGYISKLAIAVASLLLLLSMACNCSASSQRAASPGAVTRSDIALPDLPQPGRQSSAQRYPASLLGKDYLADSAFANCAVDGAAAVLSPVWDSAPQPALSDSAYCIYGLGLDDAIEDATLSLYWTGGAPAAGAGWLGIFDQGGGCWRWRQLNGGEVPVGAAQQYVDASGNLYAAVVLLGAEPRTLSGISLAEQGSGAVVLGCPGASAVSASVLAEAGTRCYLEYGTTSGQYGARTAEFTAGDAPEILALAGLSTDTQYYYRLCRKAPGEADFVPGAEAAFHTARAAGSQYVFAIQADPHLDERTSTELYGLTLANILADRPDFMLDLGDNFMIDEMGNPATAEIVERLLYCRGFYAQAGHCVPLLLVQGNHDGEQGWLKHGSPEDLAIRTCLTRLAWYPSPSPDGFYSGAPSADLDCGQRGGYYAFTWGDALLVVLDPFWYTQTKPKQSGDNWDWTLGREQYDWLKATLAASGAKYKLVFIHELVGGTDTEGRGGVEAAPYFEWGGQNADGSWGFDTERPGWGKPVHQLLVDSGIDIVFHGHDHFYDKQELDGVVYQLVPQPGNTDLKVPPMVEDYGYLSGTILPGSGHLRVTVAGDSLTVEFIQAVLPGSETQDLRNGRVADRYLINSQ